MTAASTRALLIEKANGIVNAVVMDSRGVYMAENKERVEQFGKPLLENLKRIDTLLAQWRPLVPVSQMDQFLRTEQRMAEFIEFRTKLVELGRTNGSAAAREWGDNDANRTNRQALNKELQGIAAQNAEMISIGSAELQAFYGTMLTTLALLTVLGVGIALAFLMVRMTVTRPLADITGTMKRLAEGDAGVTVKGVDRGDEIGEMARTIGVFRDNMERSASLEQQRRADDEAREQRRLNLERLTHDFGVGIDKVVEAVSSQAVDMRASSTAMSAIAEETSRQSHAAASASEEARVNVQTVASAAEELSSSIDEIGRQVAESSRIATVAVAEVERTNESVTSLAAAAEKIGEVVNLINDIASQTNLLALNATIEAAPTRPPARRRRSPARSPASRTPPPAPSGPFRRSAARSPGSTESSRKSPRRSSSRTWRHGRLPGASRKRRAAPTRSAPMSTASMEPPKKPAAPPPTCWSRPAA